MFVVAYRTYAAPRHHIRLYYQSHSERVESKPPVETAGTNEFMVVPWFKYQAPTRLLRLYYFNTVPGPRVQSAGSNQFMVVPWSKYQAPTRLLKLYYLSTPENVRDAAPAQEHGRNFVARRLYEPRRTPLAIRARLYYHSHSERVEDAPAQEVGRSFTARRIWRAYSAPKRATQLYYLRHTERVERFVVEPGRHFVARRLFKSWRAPALSRYLYLHHAERVEGKVRDQNTSIIAYRNFRKRTTARSIARNRTVYRLYYLSHTERVRDRPAEEVGRSFTTRRFWRFYVVPRSATNLYYLRGSERFQDAVVPPVEFGRHFVARRLFRQRRLDPRILYHYYFATERVEDAPAAPVVRVPQTRITLSMGFKP